MRQLNKILLLFICVLIVAMGAIWEFLQTDFFGSNLSKNLNRFTQKELGVSVSFDRLEFQLFPPGANLNNAHILIDREDVKGEVKASKFGVYFNLLDSFRTKLTVKEFMISDASIFFEEFQKKSDSENKKDGPKFELSKSLDELRETMPFIVEKGLLRNVLINYGGKKQFIDLFSVLAKNKSLVLHGDLRNIDLAPYTDLAFSVDRVHLRAEVFDERARIDRLEVYDELSSLEIKGYINRPLGDWQAKLEGQFAGEVSQADKFLRSEAFAGTEKGVLSSKFSFTGNLKNFKGKLSFDLDDFQTKYASGDKLSGSTSFDENAVILESAMLKNGDGKLLLKRPHLAFLIKEKTFGKEPIELSAAGIRLSNALSFLPALDPLKGAVYGDFKVGVGDESVRIFADQELEVRGLSVQVNKNAPILQADSIQLIKPEFNISKGVFLMTSKAKIRETKFEVVGRVSQEELSFVVNKGVVDLQELGPWAGFDIQGVGEISLSTFRKNNGVFLKVGATNIHNFSFENYKLESLTADLLFDFANKEIIIEQAKGEQGKALAFASASINYGSLDIGASGKLEAKRFSDVQEILSPLIGDFESVSKDLYGNWDFSFNIDGKATLDDLRLKGNFNGTGNYVFNEGLDKITFDLLLEDKLLTFKDIVASKGGGNLKGEFALELGKSEMDYRFTMQNVQLSEVSHYAHSPFAFDGVLSGKVVGSKSKTSQNLLMDFKLEGTKLAGESYPDSGLSLALNSDEAIFETNLLGDTAKMEGRLKLSSKEESHVDLAINSKDIKGPLGLLKFVDRGALELEGEVGLKARAKFKGLDYEDADLVVNLLRLKLKKDDLYLDYSNKEGPQILVDSGAIKKWNISLKGRRIYLISNGEGDFRDIYDIDNKFKIDGSVLEVFNNIVSQSNGTLRARAKFYKNLLKEDYEATILGDNLSLSSDKLPSTITQGDFKLEYRNRKILLERLVAKLSSGKVMAKGSVGFSGLVPTIDLTAKFEEAGFPILKKSNLVVGGEVTLSGNKLPYSLNGEVKIQKLLLMNEITEFQQGKEATFKKEYDYLPEQLNSVANNFVNMNIDIETVEPIILSNSLADVGLLGNAQVIGGEQDFRLVGKFNLAPRQNKIYFKSNEYILTKANIFFYERNKVSNPELDISAYSVINDYRVNIKVYGPVDDFNLELSSEPALTQEDVLSLIAFGYTEDLSSNLSEQEKESMTRAGVGSIIFDSFKINETLKNEFGLQVNLGTQIQKSNQSYLSRVNSDSPLGRVSSATTIEVKKQLNDAVNLSVSSTVGGSIGQRQSMNLNYNINNKLSVEGVYQTRTNDEGEETINDSSLGADVKIRWSFK